METKHVLIGAVIIVAGLFVFSAYGGRADWDGLQKLLGISGFDADDSPIDPPIQTNKVIYADDMAGSDIGAKVNQANSACGTTSCQIIVKASGRIEQPILLSDNRTLTFQGSNYVVVAAINAGNLNEIKGVGSGKTLFTRDPTWYAGKGADERTSPPGDFNTINNADMFKVVGKRSVVIHDLAIDGSTQEIGWYPVEGVIPKPTGKDFHMPKGQQNEIAVYDSRNVNITKVKVIDVQAHAIGARGSTGLRISESELSSDGWNKYQLIWIGQRQNSDILVKHNYIHDSSHAGIFMAATTGIIIEENLLDHNRVNTFATGPGGQIGLQEDTDNIIIRNNKIINAGYTPAAEVPKRGIDILGHGMEIHSQNIQILNNDIHANAGTGISLKDNGAVGARQTNNVLIEGNKIYGNGVDGSKAENSTINIDPGLSGSVIQIQNNDFGGEGVITSFTLIPGQDQ